MERVDRAAIPLVCIGATQDAYDTFRDLMTQVSPEAGVGFVLVPDLPPQQASLLADVESDVGIAINTTREGSSSLAYISDKGAQLLGREAAEMVGGDAFPSARDLEWPTEQGARHLTVQVSRGRYMGHEAEFILFQDASRRQRREQVSIKRLGELADANSELRQFIQATAHDLRAPLRSISNFTGLLGRRLHDRLDGIERRLMENIIEGTRRMDALVEALAELASVGTRKPEIEEVDLAALLADVLSDLGADLDDPDLHLEVGPLPCVRGDALLLRQLLQNMISNALKFRRTTPHKIRVTARVDPEVVVEVEDNGIGFDVAAAEGLFSPFRRFHDAEDFPGSGLGLATCKRIVDLHQGHIEVESAPDLGTKLRVSLPTLDPQAA